MFVTGSKGAARGAIMTIWERAPRAAVHRAPDLELVALHGSPPPRRPPENTHPHPATDPTNPRYQQPIRAGGPSPDTTTTPTCLYLLTRSPQPNQQRQDTLGNQTEPPLRPPSRTGSRKPPTNETTKLHTPLNGQSSFDVCGRCSSGDVYTPSGSVGWPGKSKPERSL